MQIEIILPHLMLNLDTQSLQPGHAWIDHQRAGRLHDRWYISAALLHQLIRAVELQRVVRRVDDAISFQISRRIQSQHPIPDHPKRIACWKEGNCRLTLLPTYHLLLLSIPSDNIEEVSNSPETRNQTLILMRPLLHFVLPFQQARKQFAHNEIP